MTLIVIATIQGVVDQADQIGAAADSALDEAADEVDALGVDEAALADVRAATEEAGPMIAGGFLTAIVSGVGTLVGIASG